MTRPARVSAVESRRTIELEPATLIYRKKVTLTKQIYPTRKEARKDLFDYIEMFYNPKRRHSHIGGVSPEAFSNASGYNL